MWSARSFDGYRDGEEASGAQAAQPQTPVKGAVQVTEPAEEGDQTTTARGRGKAKGGRGAKAGRGGGRVAKGSSGGC